MEAHSNAVGVLPSLISKIAAASPDRKARSNPTKNPGNGAGGGFASGIVDGRKNSVNFGMVGRTVFVYANLFQAARLCCDADDW